MRTFPILQMPMAHRRRSAAPARALLNEDHKFVATHQFAPPAKKLRDALAQVLRSEQTVQCPRLAGRPCCFDRWPCFHRRTRELYLDGKFVHCFGGQASNLVPVLVAFEERGWPDWIDDPLRDLGKFGSRKRRAPPQALAALPAARRPASGSGCITPYAG